MAYPRSPYLPRLGHLEFLDIDEEELDTSSLQARLVQPPTRDILLSSTRGGNSSTRDEFDADTLLADLGLLAPSVATDFIPKGVTEANLAFRLINDVDFYGEEEEYIALSYCSKKTNRDTPKKVVEDLPFAWTREVEQFPLPTSGALFQAVLRERRIGEGLWFDQVCINQDDDVERATTLGAVDTIYKNARVVVVALDDVIATQEEEQFLRLYLDQYSYCDLPLHQQPNANQNPPFLYQYPAFRSFFGRFIESEWFERAWCAHEMRNGQEQVFLLRCSTQYDDEVQSVIRFTAAFVVHMLVLASELSTFTSTQQARIQTLNDFFSTDSRTRKKNDLAVRQPDTPQAPLHEPLAFVPMIVNTFQMKAGGNPRLPGYMRRLDANRDKACIALSASGLPITLAPANQYQRPHIEDEWLHSLLLVGLAARDPVCLCTTGTPLQLHDGSTSWLSRPTLLDTHASTSAPQRFPKPSNPIRQSTDGRAEYVQLDLIFLGLPHRTHPNPLFPSHIARARLFIHICMQFRIPGPGTWSFWQFPNHPRSASMLNAFIQTLGCIFDCGAQWLLDLSLSLSLNHHNFPLSHYAIDMLLNPHLIIQNYILLPEGRAALSALLTTISTLLVSGIPWASGATECTYGPLIVSAPTQTLLPDPSHPSTNKAILFTPFTHSKTLLIAVPDAVKAAEYSGLARAWVLTSMNPYTGGETSVCWTLQSKGVVFGDSGFKGGLEGCGEGERTGCRVYGPC